MTDLPPEVRAEVAQVIREAVYIQSGQRADQEMVDALVDAFSAMVANRSEISRASRERDSLRAQLQATAGVTAAARAALAELVDSDGEVREYIDGRGCRALDALAEAVKEAGDD